MLQPLIDLYRIKKDLFQRSKGPGDSQRRIAKFAPFWAKRSNDCFWPIAAVLERPYRPLAASHG